MLPFSFMFISLYMCVFSLPFLFSFFIYIYFVFQLFSLFFLLLKQNIVL